MAKAAVTCLTPEASTILMNPKLDIHWLFSLNVQPGIRGDGVHVFKCDFYEISFWLVWLPVEPGVMQMMHHVVEDTEISFDKHIQHTYCPLCSQLGRSQKEREGGS